MSALSRNIWDTVANPGLIVADGLANTGSLSSLSFANSNGVSFGLNGSTLTASVTTGGGGGSVVSAIGTLGALSTGSITLVAGNNITLATGLNLITIAGPNVPAATNFSLNGSSSSVSLVAGNNISLASVASTITISAIPQTSITSNLPPRLSYTQNFPLPQAFPVSVGILLSSGTTGASQPGNPFGSSLSLQRIFIPAVMSLTEVDLAFGISFPATSSGQGSLTQSFVIYSFGNSTSLVSLLSSSRAVSWASGTSTSGTASTLQQGWSGTNIQPFTFAASSLSAGEYAVAHLMSWAAQSTPWTISVYGLNAVSSFSRILVNNITTFTGAAAVAFTAVTSPITAFTATPTSAAVLLTASGTSVALLGASAFTSSASAAITAFSGAPTVASVLVGVSGTSTALTGASAFTASNSANITAFSAAPTVASVLVAVSGTSTALTAASAHTASGSTAITAWTAAASAFAIGKVGSTASGSTNTASLVSVTATANSTISLLLNTATGGVSLMSSNGLLAGSFFTASTSVAAFTGGTGASAFLSSNGLSAGSFFTASTSVGAFTGGTGASSFLSTGGLVAGSFFTTSASAGVISNSGTALVNVVNQAGAGSLVVLTDASTVTASGSFGTFGLPSFGYNGSLAMTTNSTQESWMGQQFDYAIMSTGSSPVSIDLGSTAITVTGSKALDQPWFALCGS